MAIAAASMALALMIFFFTARALRELGDLDRTIDRLESQLIRNTELAARGVSVDRAFEQVATQHSSEWTPAEIHDRLRREIQRLAQLDPDAPAESAKSLVEIPILRQGSLKDNEQGYREYSISIRPAPTNIKSILTFLIRLQSSPQSLRIDGLDLSRAPESDVVAANINVTRIVVEGAATTESKAAAGTEPETRLLEWQGAAIQPWQADQCELVIDPPPEAAQTDTPVDSRLRAVAKAAKTEIYVALDLEGGMTYELNTDIAVSGQAALQILDAATGQPYEGRRDLTADGTPYRYRILFTVPPSDAPAVPVHAPSIVAAEGAVIEIDNLVLTQKAAKQ